MQDILSEDDSEDRLHKPNPPKIKIKAPFPKMYKKSKVVRPKDIDRMATRLPKKDINTIVKDPKIMMEEENIPLVVGVEKEISVKMRI